jgi:uncharacterized protein (TIGR02118 family)
MSAKIVVLYPQPKDPEQFEISYVGQHLPLMRRLLGPDVSLPTYRIRSTPQRPTPFYRMAEIHFPTLAELIAFAALEDSPVARASSEEVSSGGAPIVFVCERQADV